jgi:hypothetical protein
MVTPWQHRSETTEPPAGEDAARPGFWWLAGDPARPADKAQRARPRREFWWADAETAPDDAGPPSPRAAEPGPMP